MATLPSLRVGLQLDSAAFIREARRVQAEVSALNKSFAIAGTAVKALGAAFGGLIGGISVAALAQAGKNALDMAGGLKELAQQAGVTTRELQILQLAGTQFGVSSEQINTSLAQFGRRLGEASQEGKGLSDTLKKYSISLTDAQGKTRSSYNLLGDLAEAIQNASTEQERLAIAAEAFGSRVGAKMLPALIGGREGLDAIADSATRAGLILGDEFINAADRASDALSAMQFAFSKGFQIGVVEEFADAISDSNDALVNARAAGEEFGRVIGAAMSGAIEIAKALTPAFNVMADTFNSMGSSGQAFIDSLRSVGIVSEDIDSINRKLVDLESTRREIIDTMAKQGDMERGAGATTLFDVTEQIAALEQQKAELQDLAKAQTALDNATKPVIKTLQQWKEELLGGVAAAKEANNEIAKLAVLGLADVEFQASNLGVEEAKKEVAAHEEALRRKQQLSEQAAREASQEEKRAADERQRYAEKQVADEYNLNVEFAERYRRLRGENAREAAEEETRLAEQYGEKQQRALEGAQARQADLMQEPFKNAFTNIQNLTTDTFEQIFNEGINSFSDLASSIKKIFVRMAAEIATLSIFRGVQGGFGGLFGTAGAAAASANTGTAATFGAGATTAGGNFIPALASAPWWQRGRLSGGGLAVAGGLGAAGGGLLGGMFGGNGQIGGSIGGGLGAVLGGLTPIGPLGAAGGGLLGALAGGLAGSLFGGSSGARRSTIGGGALGGTGSGEAAQLAAGIDKQIQQILTSTQESVVNAALAVSEAIKVEFNKKKGLSEGDKSRIAAVRLGPAATALGFNAAAITGAGDAEAQVSAFQEAVNAKDAIDALRGTLKPFAFQFGELKKQFDEVTDTATKYGISLEGVAEAQQLAYAALARQQRSQFNSVAAAVGVISPVDAALNELQIQMEDFAAQASLMGISLDSLSSTHQKAAQAIIEQFDAQQSVVDNTFELTQQRRLEAHAFRELSNVWTPLERALADLQVQFENAWHEARRLGEATDQLTAAHVRAIVAVQNEQRLQVHALREQIGTFTPMERALHDLQVEFENAWHQADRLGESTANLTKAHERAAAAIIRENRAQVDALALSIDAPFKSMLSELDTLGLELQQSLMNPLERFEASAQHFRDITTAALAGSTTAIDQFDDAARDFIATAEQTGASAGRVKAIQEVEDARQLVAAQINQAQVQAGKGVEGAIQAASNRQVDTLRELIDVGRQQISELKRLTRSLS